MDIRLAIDEDSVDIYEWRNNLHSRKMFRNSNIIAWEEHHNWYNTALKNKSCCILVCLDNNKVKVGIIRFDIKINIAQVSINLNPKMRGKGKGKDCLKKAVLFFHKYFKNIKYLEAEIKSNNVQSKKTFESAGFRFEKSSKNYSYYSYFLNNSRFSMR